jgi:hypothetical protein
MAYLVPMINPPRPSYDVTPKKRVDDNREQKQLLVKKTAHLCEIVTDEINRQVKLMGIPYQNACKVSAYTDYVIFMVTLQYEEKTISLYSEIVETNQHIQFKIDMIDNDNARVCIDRIDDQRAAEFKKRVKFAGLCNGDFTVDKLKSGEVAFTDYIKPILRVMVLSMIVHSNADSLLCSYETSTSFKLTVIKKQPFLKGLFVNDVRHDFIVDVTTEFLFSVKGSDKDSHVFSDIHPFLDYLSTQTNVGLFFMSPLHEFMAILKELDSSGSIRGQSSIPQKTWQALDRLSTLMEQRTTTVHYKYATECCGNGGICVS